MDPYQDLRVLQQLSSLTWLRVFVHGRYDPDECLAFTFPPSLHCLELRCNRKRYAKGGSVYLRRPDPVRPLCRNEIIHLLKLLEDLSRDSLCSLAVLRVCWLQQVLWTAQFVFELSSYAGHLFIVSPLWMLMVRMTASVDMQDLLKACFQAEMPLRTVNIKSHGCFAWVGLPDGFVQLRHFQEVILQEAGLNWLPEGPWLQQLKILDLSHNSFSRIPPVLTSCKGTLQKLVLSGALEKRPVAVVSDDASSAEGSGSEGSQHGSRSQSSCLPQEREAEAVPVEDTAMTPGEFERFASARGDEAFSATTCRAVYQELLDAGIDVQITEAALSDSW